MNSDAAEIYRLIVEIRRAFHTLANAGDALHADLGVTSAMRAQMEYLSDHGPATVPDIARAKSVSRQHIQQLVNGLEASGLVRFSANPRHRRSPLVALTEKGVAAFAEIRQREAAVLGDLARRLDGAASGAAADTIARLRAVLDVPDADVS